MTAMWEINFEFIYSMSVMLLIMLADMLSLNWLEKKEDLQITKHLKFQSSPIFIFGAIAYAWLTIYFIPGVFDFNINVYGYLIVSVVYIPWGFKVRKPRWLALMDRANQAKMEEKGQKGDRMADLRVRRIGDYLSWPVRSIPYVILLGTGIHLVSWMYMQGSTQLGKAGYFIFSQFIFAVGLTLFVHWLMLRLVKDPLDLRSFAPARFAKKMHVYIKWRMWALWLGQITYLLTMLTMILSLMYGFPSTFWFTAGFAPFLASMVWLAISSVRGMARLEEQRWQEEQRETEIKA